MRISEWSSDVCSSDLRDGHVPQLFSAESALTPAWPTTDIRAPRRPAALQPPPTLPHPCVASPAWPCPSGSWVGDSASGPPAKLCPARAKRPSPALPHLPCPISRRQTGRTTPLPPPGPRGGRTPPPLAR